MYCITRTPPSIQEDRERATESLSSLSEEVYKEVEVPVTARGQLVRGAAHNVCPWAGEICLGISAGRSKGATY